MLTVESLLWCSLSLIEFTRNDVEMLDYPGLFVLCDINVFWLGILQKSFRMTGSVPFMLLTTYSGILNNIRQLLNIPNN